MRVFVVKWYFWSRWLWISNIYSQQPFRAMLAFKIFHRKYPNFLFQIYGKIFYSYISGENILVQMYSNWKWEKCLENSANILQWMNWVIYFVIKLIQSDQKINWQYWTQWKIDCSVVIRNKFTKFVSIMIHFMY